MCIYVFSDITTTEWIFAGKKIENIFFLKVKKQVKTLSQPLEGLDWLWVSGLKTNFGCDLAPGWPFTILGNFFEFPLVGGGEV